MKKKRIIPFIIFIFMSIPHLLVAQQLLVGTYTNGNQPGKGLYIFDFSNEGQLQLKQSLVAENPSFQVVGKNSAFVYSVNETDPGNISAYAYEGKKKELKFLNAVPAMGAHPCHLTLDQTKQWIICSNYSSGNFSIYKLESDGTLGPLSQVVQHQGSSVNKSRQAAPHVHSATMDPKNQFLYICDLGTDKITGYPFNALKGKVDTSKALVYAANPGNGPRHMTIDATGKFGYNVDEMSATVNSFRMVKGGLKKIQTMAHTGDGPGLGAGADIHLSPDQQFLYVSQRSNSTIEIYRVQFKTGLLQFVAAQPTGGNFPRNFTIHPSGKFLLVANQKSSDLTVFKINKKTGLLTSIGEPLKIGTPVSLQWL